MGREKNKEGDREKSGNTLTIIFTLSKKKAIIKYTIGLTCKRGLMTY